MNIIECWDCSGEYDMDRLDYCPYCSAYPDEDNGYYDYEELEEDDDDNDNYFGNKVNNNLKKETMKLAALKEVKRTYKGLTPVTEYINKNFVGVTNQFTPDLIGELLGELANEETIELVTIQNNRLYMFCPHYLSYFTDNNDKSFENIFATWRAPKPIDGSERGGTFSVKVSDIYIIDRNELRLLEIAEDERRKTILVEEQTKVVAEKEKEIAEKKQYLADIKTYGTEDRVKIRQLKAVKILRDKSTSDEDYIKAVQEITSAW